MAESVVLPLLTEVAKPMVKLVVSRVTEEIHFFRKFERELNHLLEKILMIASTVDGMPDHLVADKAVELWLRKALRIIHDAENLMDVLAYDKHRSVVMRRRPKKITRLVFSPLKRVYFRRKMGSWIRRINTNIEAALKEAHTIHGLMAFVQSAISLQPAATNISDGQGILQQVRQNVDTSLFVGRDRDVEFVLDMLCNPAQTCNGQISSNRLSVIAIVGIGGMGKTTLAKKVYENEMVLSHFNERIWISDLKDLIIERVLNQMVMSLGIGSCENAGTHITTRRLEEHLGGKRYLLVLDDVWNTNQLLWDSMRSALEGIGGSNDSMILTTTRNNAVANTMDASVHSLLELLEDASWLLFKQIAFANWSDKEVFALESIGMKIVKKCMGVPLAIKSIAGTLNKKRNPHEWAIIEQSELWGTRHDETGILPSLELSHNHLSPMLKKCFSICAFLPKGWYCEKYELICRWMALGLLRYSSNGSSITVQDIGEEYLNELLSISFLLVKRRDELGEAIEYTLHDLVHDLARSVAMHERVYLGASKKENKAADIQHLRVDDHAEITSDFPDKLALQNLSSLEMIYNLPRELLRHVKYLRVLSLEHSTIEVVPKSIGQLKCLKYLHLENNPIKLLPECVMELYNLQSLCLYRCKPLSILPKGLSNLVNLQHLGLSFHLCPTKGTIGQLNELQTLPPLQLSEGGFEISELGCLDHVKGNLDIKGLELIKSKLDAENSGLSMKARVEQLRLSWDNDDNHIKHEAVLDGLHPNRNLKLLSIKGYEGDKFPPWLMRMNVPEDRNNGYAGSLCNLMKVELIDCGRCQQVPTMGHLPLLKLIKIRNMKSLKQIGPEWYGDAELLLGNSNEASSSGSSPRVKSKVYFESLKELRLSGLGNLEEWCEAAAGPGKWDGFPSLEVLVIERCWGLKEAPDKFPSLKELIVKFMDSSNPLMKVVRNKRSVSNLTKLEIVNVLELRHIPEEVGECTSLQELIIQWCPKLESISNVSRLGSLREVNLDYNEGLRGAPEGLESCKSLETLWINGCGKVETVPDLSRLSRLWNLGIIGMRKMIRQPPDWVFHHPSLRLLHIGNYVELKEEFPDISWVMKMTCLDKLYVYGWEKLQNIPAQLQYFTALKTLAIVDFNSVEQLPDWLGNLSSLQNLYLTRCKSLIKLPSKEAMDRLTKLSILDIEDCPLLAKAVDRDGPEYHKIAAKPHIQVLINNSTS